MATVKTKERINLLASDVRRSQSETALAVKELLGLLLSELKDNLVTSTGADTLRVQGGAQALERLYKMLTQEPSPIKRQAGDNQ